MDDAPMSGHPSVVERLARLAPDQRAAATAPPGPVLCVAPAGSGKTTTLVARVAWLVDGGSRPGGITVVAFNKRAAEELDERSTAALTPLEAAGQVRVRTFHALGREILADAGVAVEPLVDRVAILRSIEPGIDRARIGRLDLAISRLKLDLQVSPDEVAADPLAGPIARAYVAYEQAVAAIGGLDFDDLIVRSFRALQGDAALLERWRARCHDLLVDEAQDLDRSQLDLALLLAAPANRVFLVGDDDQTIYGWRLADVRRVLGLVDALPGLRRLDLTVNYRCPEPVVRRAVRLVEGNAERFVKTILPRPSAPGRLVLAPDATDDVIRIGRAIDAWPRDGGTRSILTRTNRELLPAVIACLERSLPFRAPPLPQPLLDPRLDRLLALLAETDSTMALLVRVASVRDRIAREPALVEDASPTTQDDDLPSPPELGTALLAWSARYRSLEELTAAVAERRERLTRLHRDDADLTLATAHGTKGLEFDHVVVLADGFPAKRAVGEAVEPQRVLEEERRLAYVAWTRARRSLTLVYDPVDPSPFLREAFAPSELGAVA
jgi:superfamily I DNA/RNA helicase